MNTHRSDQLLKIRPTIETANLNLTSSEAELFQNQTLRPIIKFQNDLLVEVFKNYLAKRNLKDVRMSEEKLNEIIDQIFQRDTKFKTSIQSIIIGQFTVEEYHTYCTRASEINRRISQIIKERLVSNLHNF